MSRFIIVLIRYCLDDQSKENVMIRDCSTHRGQEKSQYFNRKVEIGNLGDRGIDGG
jgi:hypothetical protein